MKSYEELLSDIEDDMELMGALHIVYSMEEDGVVTGYDYLPEDSCTISMTLKELQEKIHQQMLYDKASAYTIGSDKNAPKLAVVFPGSDILLTSRFCTIQAVLPANIMGTRSALYPMEPSRKMSKVIRKNETGF